MRRHLKLLAWLLMAAMLLTVPAVAESSANFMKANLSQGQTVVISGTLRQEQTASGATAIFLTLDQPLDVYMMYTETNYSEAMLSSVQVKSGNSMDSLIGKHVMVMGDVAFGGGEDTYCAIVVQNATAAESTSYATVAESTSAPVSYAQPSQPVQAQTAYNVQANGNVNVRTSPGQSASSLGALAKGEQVSYLNESTVDSSGNTWYKVQYYSFGTGWVSAQYTKLVPAGEVGVASTSNVTSGDYVVGTGGDSKLRSEPNLRGSELGVLRKGASATYLNQSSVDERGVRWYYVNCGGTVAWVSSRYTTLQTSSSTIYTPDYSSGSGLTTYVRATARVWLREAPDPNSDDVGDLAKGEKVVYLGETSSDTTGTVWYKIQNYSRGTAWVTSQYTEIVTDYAGSAGVATTDEAIYGSYVEADGGRITVRSAPNLDADDVAAMVRYDTATYLGQSSVDERGVRWYYVNFNGTNGWVSSRFTSLH